MCVFSYVCFFILESKEKDETFAVSSLETEPKRIRNSTKIRNFYWKLGHLFDKSPKHNERISPFCYRPSFVHRRCVCVRWIITKLLATFYFHAIGSVLFMLQVIFHFPNDELIKGKTELCSFYSISSAFWSKTISWMELMSVSLSIDESQRTFFFCIFQEIDYWLTRIICWNLQLVPEARPMVTDSSFVNKNLNIFLCLSAEFPNWQTSQSLREGRESMRSMGDFSRAHFGMWPTLRWPISNSDHKWPISIMPHRISILYARLDFSLLIMRLKSSWDKLPKTVLHTSNCIHHGTGLSEKSCWQTFQNWFISKWISRGWYKSTTG